MGPDCPLGGAIRLRDRRTVTLGLHLDGSKPGQDLGAGEIGGRFGDARCGRQVDGGHDARITSRVADIRAHR